MIDKHKIIHDLTMLHLEKTFDFKDDLEDEMQLAIEYEHKYESIKSYIDDVDFED